MNPKEKALRITEIVLTAGVSILGPLFIEKPTLPFFPGIQPAEAQGKSCDQEFYDSAHPERRVRIKISPGEITRIQIDQNSPVHTFRCNPNGTFERVGDYSISTLVTPTPDNPLIISPTTAANILNDMTRKPDSGTPSSPFVYERTVDGEYLTLRGAASCIFDKVRQTAGQLFGFNTPVSSGRCR